ncbi:9930_t:CDS:1, partial [Cetraspora pellucida]
WCKDKPHFDLNFFLHIEQVIEVISVGKALEELDKVGCKDIDKDNFELKN